MNLTRKCNRSSEVTLSHQKCTVLPQWKRLIWCIKESLAMAHTTKDDTPHLVDQSFVNDAGPFPIIDLNPAHPGPKANLKRIQFYIEWQVFDSTDGAWQYVILVTPC